MSTSIDERVVKLRFDNKQFEQGAAESLSTLDKLKEKLEFKGMSFENVKKAFTNIGKASKTTSLDKFADNIETIASRFSTTGIIATTALVNIANTAVETGKKVVSSLTNQAIQGGIKRAFNIEQAKFRIEGLGMSWKKLSDDINYGVLDTAYGFDEAAVAASSLAASSVKAGDDMKRALLSISGVAAMTGSSYGEIADIFTTVAGRGKLLTEQLNQLSHRGLNGAVVIRDYLNANKDLMKQAIDVGLESKGYGKYVKEFADSAKLTEDNVRTLVSAGAISFDIFSKSFESFGDHAKDANQTFTGVVSNMKASLSRMGAMFATPAIQSQKSDKLISKSGYNLVTVMQNVVRVFKVFEKYLKSSGVVDIFTKKLHQFSKVASLFLGAVAAQYSTVTETIQKVEKVVGKNGKIKKVSKEYTKVLAEQAIQVSTYNKKTKEYEKHIITSETLWKRFGKTLKNLIGLSKPEFDKLVLAFMDVSYVAKQAFGIVRRDIKSIFGFIKETILGNVWKTFINSFVRFRILFATITDTIYRIYSKVKGIVVKVADAVVNAVSSIWGGIHESFSNILSFIKGFEDGFNLVADVVEFVVDSLKPLTGVFKGIVKIVLSLVGGISRVVSGIYSIIKSSGIFKRVSSVISWAIGNAVDLFNWLSDVVSNFVDYLTNSPIFNAFIELFSSIAEVIGNFYGVISNAVMSIVDAIFNPIKEHSKDGREVNKFVNGIVQGIADAILWVAGVIKKYGNIAVDFIDDLLHNKYFITFITALGAPLLGLLGIAKSIFDLVIKHAPKVIDAIKKFFGSISKSKTVTDVLGSISDLFNNSIKPAFEWIVNTVGKKLKNLKIKEFIDKHIKPGLDWLLDFFTTQIKKIKFGEFYEKNIKPGLKAIGDFLGKTFKKINFGKIGNNIKKFISNFKFKDAIKGLKTFWKWVYKKTSPAVKDFYDNLKKLVNKFPSTKIGKGFKFIADEISKLVDKLKKLDFKEALEGFKDFGKNLGSKIIEGFKSIDFGKMFDTAKEAIGKFIGFLDDAIRKVAKKAGKLGKAAKDKALGLSSNLGNKAGANASAALNASSGINAAEVSSGIWNVIKSIGETIRNGISKIKEILPSPKELGLAIGDLISKAIGFVLELIPPLVETIAFAIRGALENLPEQVSKFSSRISKSLKSAFLEPIEDSTGAMSDDVPKMFYAVKDAFEKIYGNIEEFIEGLTFEKVQKFVNLINSVLLGMLLRAIIKSVKKHNSILKTFGDIVEKFGGTIADGASKIASAFAGIGTAISTGISNVFKGLENIEKAYEKEINSRKIKNYAESFKLFAQSMLMIVGAVIVLSFIPADKIKAGIERMGMIMLEIIAFVAILRAIAWKNLEGVGKVNMSLMQLAGGLAIFAATMVIVSLIPWPNIMKGLAAMAGVLAVISVFFAALSSGIVSNSVLNKIGVVMLQVAGAIAILSVSLALLTALDSGKLIGAAMAIGLLMLALAGITKIINLETVASLSALAKSLLLVSIALLPMMLMPVENIIKGILGLAAALVVLGAVAWLGTVTGATAAIAALGASLIPFGIGLALTTGAVWLLVQALIAIGKAKELVIDGLQAICDFVPEFIKAMADGIADSSYELAMMLTKLLLSVLQSLGDSVAQFIEVGAKIIIEIMDGISMMMPRLVDSAVNLVTSFFLSLAVAIDGNQQEILSSIAALLGSILNLIITAVEQIGVTLFGFIPGAEGKITGACEAAKDKVKDILGDGSVALAAKQEAEKTAKETEQGMKDVEEAYDNGGKNSKEAFEEQVSKLPGFQNLNNKEMDKLWKKFSKDATNEAKKGGENAVKENQKALNNMPKNTKKATKAYTSDLSSGMKEADKAVKSGTAAIVKNADVTTGLSKSGKKGGKAYESGMGSVDISKAGKSLVSEAAKGTEGAKTKFFGLGENVPEGYASGVYNKADTVYNAVKDIVKKAYEEGKKAQKSNSPSKLYARMGEWVPEGYAAGIDETADLVKKSVKNMVNGGIKAASQLAPALNYIMNLDEMSDPVIRPVLDLSNVQNGVNQLNSMFNSRYALGVAGSIGKMNSSKSPISIVNNITVSGAEDPSAWADEFVEELEVQVRMG